jgi:hypothetical protein
MILMRILVLELYHHLWWELFLSRASFCCSVVSAFAPTVRTTLASIYKMLTMDIGERDCGGKLTQEEERSGWFEQS